MPKKLTEKNREYFAFSVATKKGISSGGFGNLMNQIMEARIKLRSLSAFVVGRRTKVICDMTKMGTDLFGLPEQA